MTTISKKVTCGLSLLPDDPSDVRAFREGAATLWLWAWPSLLDWPLSVLWLFSPVKGNTKWPGDLWGVDSAGDLLIVEAKVCEPRRRTCDPFEDFVGKDKGERVLDPGFETIQAASLRQRWLRLRGDEARFIAAHLHDLQHQKPLDGCYPGVVNYGRHRAYVQRWRQLYIQQIKPQLVGSDYPHRIDKWLCTRDQKGNPLPHVIGLGVLVNGARLALSAKGREHRKALIDRLGADHVHLISIEATRLSSGYIQIESRHAP